MAQPAKDTPIRFDNSYARQLPDFYVSSEPMLVESPELLLFNTRLSDELGLSVENLSPTRMARIFSGQELLDGAQPLAQAYAGHQFGGFVPQLGDGRALLLGEVMDGHGRRRDIALKGSGPTPFSRGGDGKAAIGPVLREYLLGEAMHALDISTTRALAAVSTGQYVMRAQSLPGAILTRVAASHVRVGTFQYFSARRRHDQVRQLADYVIERHDPELVGQPDRYLLLLKAVAERQAALVAKWMLVGFIHGVMNTDNMAISGETIDYGPCAFMESYDPTTVFSSIDHAGRYAFGNQPNIALWNLVRFAETLLPLFADGDEKRAVADATAVLETFMPTFEKNWYEGARAKLGLANPGSNSGGGESESVLIDDWIELLSKNKVDYTLAWRCLAEAADGDASELKSLFVEQAAVDAWLEKWKALHKGVSASDLASAIREVNPLYIPRNHLVEEALASASDEGDLTLFRKLLQVVQSPFEEDPQLVRYAGPAPADFTANYQTFCGT